MAENSHEYNIQDALIPEIERFGIKADCNKSECSTGCLNIGKELLKERKRVIQWRILNEATVILNSRLHSESLPLKFIKCAKKLVSAREAMLALKEENGTGLRIVKHYTYYDHYNQFEELGQRAKPQEKLVEDQVYEPQGVIKIILEKGEIIDRNSTRFRADDLWFLGNKKNLLGCPLLQIIR